MTKPVKTLLYLKIHKIEKEYENFNTSPNLKQFKKRHIFSQWYTLLNDKFM